MPLVLVVDPHPETLAQREEHLARTLGYRTMTADNGADAVSVAAAWRPDVIVLDLLNVRLPGSFDGWNVARQLKTGRDAEDFSLIALAHYVSASDRRQAAALGCAQLLVNPSVGLLGETVRRCLVKRAPPRRSGSQPHEPASGNDWVVPSSRETGKRWTEDALFLECARRELDLGSDDLLADTTLLTKLSEDSGWRRRELVVAILRRRKEARKAWWQGRDER